MAGFRKAKAEQAALKMGLYGPPGSGKTFTALLLAEGLARATGKRVAFVDTERGTDFYSQAVPTRKVHPEAFDFDALYTKSLTEVNEAVKKLKPEEYGVVVIDSITHLWEAAIASYSGRQTSVGSIPMHAWGKIKRPYKELMAFLLSTPMHVFILGRQGTVFETDEETEELKAVGVKMKAEGETPYEPHILIRMEVIRPKKTNEVADIVAYAEKDRTGVLAGRSFVNPNFDSICKPLLGLLGDKQAKVATPDETAAVDSEALAEADALRTIKSGDNLRELKAELALAKTWDDVRKIGARITPQLKSEMLPHHVSELRDYFGQRQGEVPGAPAKKKEGAEAEA